MTRSTSDWMKTATHTLLWLFAMAWAFDFKADVQGGAQGGSGAQVLFLGTSIVAGFGAMALNFRHLTVRPGVWLLLLWFGFLGYIALTSLGQRVHPGHFIRVLLPYVMIGLGMAVAHVAACRGLRPVQIVTPMVMAGVVNVVWRIFYGFAFKGATLETARMEVFSPAMNPLFAYLGCAFLLRPKFHWANLLVAAIALSGVFISVTRALIFPIAVAALLGCGCFVLGLAWRVFHVRQIPQKLAVFAVAAACGLAVMGIVWLVSPVLIERWTERLFHHAGGQTSKDLSWLTREAEAKAMFDILSQQPLSFVIGKGMGADYYWDASYWPELYTVYPLDYDFSEAIWFNGHSIWTYTTFSGGAVGILFHLALFVGGSWYGVASVRRQSGSPHPEAWLGFLPLFSILCLLSESFTSNQLAERLAGSMLGLSIGLPQALFLSARTLRRVAPRLVAVRRPTPTTPPALLPVHGH